MRILRLTNSVGKGEPIFINPLNVVGFEQQGAATSVYTTADNGGQPLTFFVFENADRVEEMMNAALKDH